VRHGSGPKAAPKILPDRSIGTEGISVGPIAPSLRPYQLEAISAVESAGAGPLLVVLPTGTGKTVVFASLIRDRGGRALVVAHRDELLGQAEHKLIAAGIPAGSIGRVQAGRDDCESPVVLGSAQTLARSSRRTRLLDAQLMAGPFSTVVIDEAHHAVAKSYRALLADLAGGPLVIGLTATPNREGMAAIFGEPVYSRTLLDMIREEWLCELRGRRIARLHIDWSTIRRSHGDFVESDLADALAIAGAPEAVAAAWLEHAEGRQTLVFTAGVALAHATADVFQAHGIAAEAIDGAMELGHRHAVLDRYRTGETKIVTNCAVLTEGVDLPETSCIVIARPTTSSLLYCQMVGRGTRIAPAKSDCLVLDIVGATSRHDLSDLKCQREPVTLGSLVGVELDDGEGLLDAWVESQRPVLRVLAEHEKLVATDVSLFGRRRHNWLTLPGSPASYTLSLGAGERVDLKPDGPATYSVHHARKGSPTIWLERGLRLDAATAIAEQLARTGRARALADPGARWRSKSITEKQLQTLAKLRPDIDADTAGGLDSGMASDLISAALASGPRRRERTS
jgi:superfamily II DNA or RNA helicase